MNRWLVASCLLTIAAAGHADEPGGAWTDGVMAFQTGRERMQSGQPSRADFRRAVLGFTAAVDSRHAESYVNLGNAHYLAGDLPEAIAAYNAGLAIDPSDGRLHANLALARGEVLLPVNSKLIAPAPVWQRYLFQTYIGVVAASALVGSSLLVPFSYRLRRRRGLGVGLGLAIIAAVAGAATALRASYFDEIERRPVCVLRVDTPLRIGNAESYQAHADAPLLPRGYEFRRLDARGGWLHVVCPGGAIGWVPEGNLVRGSFLHRPPIAE